jgi:predicted transcriptional regulator
MTRMKKKGWLEVEKEGNTNYYWPAVDEGQALKEEIHQFLDQVVGSEPENLELLQKALAQLAS